MINWCCLDNLFIENFLSDFHCRQICVILDHFEESRTANLIIILYLFSLLHIENYFFLGKISLDVAGFTID